MKFLVGTILGVLAVRYFALDLLENLGWHMFWDTALKGRLNAADLRMALASTTFWKCALGGICGGLLVEGLFRNPAAK